MGTAMRQARWDMDTGRTRPSGASTQPSLGSLDGIKTNASPWISGFTERLRVQLIGLTDYRSAYTAGKYVNIRVTSPTVADAIFVGFNLATGINSGTKESQNEVTVHTQTGTGISNLVGKLNSVGTYTFANFQNGKTLSIDVKSISTSSSPPVAEVDIYLGDCKPGSSCACNNGVTCAVASVQKRRLRL